MRIKKFKARTMSEVFRLVRNDLGPQAVILNSRKIPSGLWGLGTDRGFEVTAGLDEQLYAFPEKSTAAGGLEKESSAVYYPEKGRVILKPVFPRIERTTMSNPPNTEGLNINFIQEDLREVKSALGGLTCYLKHVLPPGLVGLPEPLVALHETLMQSEIEEKWVNTVIARIRAEMSGDDLFSSELVQTRVQQILKSNLPVAGPICASQSSTPRVIALVGPTGVGKTTTLAKIAARIKLVEQKPVGIIAADSYRIAALNQIQDFADIAGIPVEAAFTPLEMQRALKKFAEKYVILIDTAGRSLRQHEHMEELKLLMDEARPHEIHLVMSLTTKLRDLKNILDFYGTISINRFIFTKLDETSAYGNLLNVVKTRALPISYLTTGQQVPQDIQVAESDALCRLICGGLVHA